MYDLSRFIKAQEYDYSIALKELSNGRKKSHWIWYIFPQIKGLGTSYINQQYSLEDIDEAKAGSLLKKVQKKHKNLEIELQYGGQPIYYYIVSAE